MNINITKLSCLNDVSEGDLVKGGVSMGGASINFSLNVNNRNRNDNIINSIANISGNTALSGGNVLASGDNTFTELNLLSSTTSFSSQSSGFATAATM